mmetsp:Transcript_99141/g.171964  ORF Transcript_99141/g.171964 Transcript_99141/m.171964 type:complete len:325 (+) Transcript_99141:68-1042(+)
MRLASLMLACLVCIVPAFRRQTISEQRAGSSYDAHPSLQKAPNRFELFARLLFAFSNPSGQRSPVHSVRSVAHSRSTAAVLASAASAWVLPDNPVWVREGRLKTVGDAKDAFYEAYGRPLTELGAAFVRDTLTAITLAQLREGFSYSRVFALGLDSLCTSFLQEIASESDREAVRRALCAALDLDPVMVKRDADGLQSFADGKTEEELLSSEDLKEIAAQKNTPAKYTYALGSGLLTLMPLVGEEVGDYTIERWCEKLKLKETKLKKDWLLYKGSLDKLNEAKAVLIEMSAQRKRREAEKLKEEADRAAKEAAEAEAALKAKDR